MDAPLHELNPLSGITSSLDGIAGGEEFRVVDSLPTGLDFLPESVTDSSGKPLFTGLYSGPYFDPARTPKNVTAQGGSTIISARSCHHCSAWTNHHF